MRRTSWAILVLWLVSVSPASNAQATSIVESSEASSSISSHQETPDPVRQALEKGEYPWYDAAKDQVLPVGLNPKRKFSFFDTIWDWIDGVLRAIGDFFAWIAGALHLPSIGGFGANTVPILLIGIGVVLLLVLIRVLWKSSWAGESDAAARARTLGTMGRITMLPDEMAASRVADPWAEAVERRRKGDYSGAIIYLFAYQLLELDRLGLLRITPGWTGRRYVKSLADSRIQEPVAATLGLFEQAYYGHKQLSATRFEPVWAGAHSLRSYLASIENRSS